MWRRHVSETIVDKAGKSKRQNEKAGRPRGMPHADRCDCICPTELNIADMFRQPAAASTR